MALPAATKHEGEKSKAGQQQWQLAPKASLVNSAAHDLDQSSHSCPGTNQTKYDCSTVSAIAAVRQADAAEYFNTVVWVEILIGALTALFAYLAARWARKAAEAGLKSYRAFVAAEDAHLILEFSEGILLEYGSGEDVRRNYSFRVTVTNVGRSAARLQQLIIETHGGSLARPIGHTLMRDASTDLPEKLLINAETAKATVTIVYATALHYQTVLKANVGLEVKGPSRKGIAYIIDTQTGRPRETWRHEEP